MNELLTTGALARATEFSVENIRVLERNGIVRAQRDSNNRRLFTREDVKIVLDYRAKRMTSAAAST